MQIVEMGTLRHVYRGGQDGYKVYGPHGLCPTILAGLGGYGLMTIEKVGDMDNSDGTLESANRVYSTGGLEPTLPTGCGGGHTPKIIVRMTGRNPENPTSREPGLPLEQRLEPNQQGMCGTLTTVQKDNLVVMETVGVRQATRQGYIEMNVGGLCDLSYPESENRRGRVIDKGETSPTLTTGGGDVCRVESRYRIRKLTPRESWRLMGFSDDDFNKAKSVSSDTQLYKQAGNSIVKQVLMAIFAQMM